MVSVSTEWYVSAARIRHYPMLNSSQVQIKVVTPDGSYLTANECENTDLCWALRGGGGNAFGVVTEVTMKVEPQLRLQA